MIPRVDPQVKYVGTTYLRILNSDKLRELTGAVVVQAENSDPLVVVIPYETYLKMQEAVRADYVIPPALMSREEAMSKADLEDLDAFDPELLGGRGKATTETRGIRQKGDGKR